MLVVAKDTNGCYVHATHAHPHVDYYDDKGKRVRVRKSSLGQAYFYHPSYTGSVSDNESATHYTIKQWFVQRSPQSMQEYYFSDIKQRADIYIPPYTVIEIQKSKITHKQLKDRHQGYQSLHMDDYWILVVNTLQEGLQRYMFCKYHPKLGCYIDIFHIKKMCWLRLYHMTTMSYQIAQMPGEICYKPYQYCLKDWKKEMTYIHKCWVVRDRRLWSLQERWYTHRYYLYDYLSLLVLPIPLMAPSKAIEWR